jgi:tetratricopeptide (TPR) repeat protein
MADSTKPNLGSRSLDDQIDRYARGELTAAESRELAQKALDDPELFENLTYSALAKEALSDASVADRLARPGAKMFWFPRKAQFVAGGAAAAVVLMLLYSLMHVQQSRVARNPPPVAQNQPPVEGTSPTRSQPILLGSNLSPGRSSTPVFRGVEAASRPPQPAGSIVSIEDGLATINLGSVDGIAKGSELGIYRDSQSTRLIGRVIVTTVFRERARGQIPEGREIRVNDQVRVAGLAHLNALLEQVDALASRGDPDAARKMAEKALKWSEVARFSPDERAKVLEKLAAFEYQAGSLDLAEMHYQSIVDTLNAAPSISKSSAIAIIYGQSLNNLGALAGLRGDQSRAESLYAEALRAFESVANVPPDERKAVETNLARSRGSH